jgi:hypothetical protein
LFQETRCQKLLSQDDFSVVLTMLLISQAVESRLIITVMGRGDLCHVLFELSNLFCGNFNVMINGKTFLGILAGLAAGTVIGILIAPKRNRSAINISRKTESLAEALNETIDAKFAEVLKNISGEIKTSKERDGVTKES